MTDEAAFYSDIATKTKQVIQNIFREKCKLKFPTTEMNQQNPN